MMNDKLSNTAVLLTLCFCVSHNIFASSPPGGGPSLTLIAQGTSDDRPRAVSNDGSLVLGLNWRWQNGILTTFQDAFRLAPDGQWVLPTGLSGDGSVVAGVGNNNDSYLYRFDNATYSTLPPPIGNPPPNGTHLGTGVTGISADGQTAIGNFDDWGPVEWLDGAVSVLPSYFGNAQALAVSGNGLIIVGWNAGLDASGTAHNYPAQWSDGTVSSLPTVQYSGVIDGRALAVSGDGLNIAGYVASSTGRAEAVLWRNGLVQPLVAPAGTYDSYALGVSDGGSRVVGKFALSCCSAADDRAFLWSQGDGAISYLGDVLGSLGVDTNGWVFYEADAVTPDGRFIVGKGSPGVFLVDLGAAGASAHMAAIPPAIQWDKSFGGLDVDSLQCIRQTSDGGYILGGYSASGISGDKTSAGFGGADYWVVKLDGSGTKVWDKSFGGSGDDYLTCLQQTADGGYILGGYSLSGTSGNKTAPNFGADDYWMVKIDANGNKVWDKSFGGSSYDFLQSLQQTSDGGYILGGYSQSGISGNKTSANFGNHDYWVVKIDVNGNKVWDKSFGGSDWDYLRALQQTGDGGYILGGFSYSVSSGNKTSANFGFLDYWIVKIDPNGNKVWDRSFGGSENDILESVQQTSDGGYILGGYSDSGISGSKTAANFGGYDYWVVKIDATGNKLWDKSFGGAEDDSLYTLQQTTDGGYILGGGSPAGMSGNKSTAGISGNDYWLVRIDYTGNKLWDLSLGGTGDDVFESLDQTKDGGLILGGFSNSTASGNRTAPNFGNYDYWVVKLGPEMPSNRPPVANDDNYTLAEDTTLVISPDGLLANDSDPDGDALTISSFGNAADGSLTILDTGGVRYQPAANFSGSDSFTYTVDDGYGGTATATVNMTITPVNDPPTAEDVRLSTPEDTPISFALTGNDVDGDPITVFILTQPAHGHVSGTEPNFTYTPDPNFNGQDQFDYQVNSAGFGQAAHVFITVTPVNDAPIARADAYSTTEDTPLHIAAPGLLANDSDVDGDTLNVIEVRVPDHGNIFADLDGSFTYTPAPHFVGPDSFRYIVSDGNGGLATNFAFISVTSGNVSALQTAAVEPGGSGSASTAPTSAGLAGVSATINNAGESPAALTVANYASNPSGSAFSAGGGFTDVQITGAAPQDTATVNFYYPSTIAPGTEVALTLVYFNGSAWVSVQGDRGTAPVKNTNDNLDGTVSGGRFTVVFSSSSMPRITELGGTFFALGVPDSTPPSVICSNVTVPCSIDLLAPVFYPAPRVSDNVDPSPKVSYSISSGAGFPVGTTAVTCTATDASGNSALTTFTVSRAALGFTGFLSPIGGADGAGGGPGSPVRTFKTGSTVPVKFTADCGGSAVASGVHRLQAIKYSASTTTGTPIDATPQDAATMGNQFRLVDGAWQFNLDTKGTGMSVGVWELIATLSDGSTHTVWIQLK